MYQYLAPLYFFHFSHVSQKSFEVSGKWGYRFDIQLLSKTLNCQKFVWGCKFLRNFLWDFPGVTWAFWNWLHNFHIYHRCFKIGRWFSTFNYSNGSLSLQNERVYFKTLHRGVENFSVCISISINIVGCLFHILFS